MKDRMKPIVASLAAMAAVIALAACGGSGDGGDGGGGGSGDSGEVAIGMIAPMSGGVASLGTAFVNGAELAVAEVNEAGGIELEDGATTLVLETCDDESAPESGVTCGRRLSSEGLPMIGALMTYTAVPMLGHNERDGVLLMTSSTAPDITESGNTLTVRVQPQDGDVDAATRWVSTAMEQWNGVGEKPQRLAVMAVDTELGVVWSETIKEAWPGASGGEFAGTVSFEQNTTDFFDKVSAVLRNKPDVIALTSSCDLDAQIINQATELGYDGLWMFQAACADTSQLTPLVNDESVLENAVFEVTPFAAGGPLVEELSTAYEEKFGSEPLFVSDIGYEMVKSWAAAAALAGTASANEVRAEMDAAMQGRADESIYGLKGVDENGSTNLTYSVGFLQGGEMTVTPAAS